MMSFRIYYKRLGGHVHTRIFSSEFGPETTHGLNGTPIFREGQWAAFRQLLQRGADSRFSEMSLSFVDETPEAEREKTLAQVDEVE
jgi:hypothetical protein